MYSYICICVCVFTIMIYTRKCASLCSVCGFSRNNRNAHASQPASVFEMIFFSSVVNVVAFVYNI